DQTFLWGSLHDLADQSPYTLHEAPSALNALLGPLNIAFRRAVGQHEPARGIGTVRLNDVGRIDCVLLRLRHLLDRADLHFVAGGYLDGSSNTVTVLSADVRRRQPSAALGTIGLVGNHSLGEKALEWLGDVEMTCLRHRPCKEARI